MLRWPATVLGHVGPRALVQSSVGTFTVNDPTGRLQDGVAVSVLAASVGQTLTDARHVAGVFRVLTKGRLALLTSPQGQIVPLVLRAGDTLSNLGQVVIAVDAPSPEQHEGAEPSSTDHDTPGGRPFCCPPVCHAEVLACIVRNS